MLYVQRFSRYRPIFNIAIFGHETWPLAKVPEIVHIFPKLSTSPKFLPRFALRLALSKILKVLHFPIGYNVNFQSFLKKFKFEISNAKKQVVCGLLQGTFRKSFVEKESKL